jgi:inorganic pyrophosphatase/exopolyphosphatase
VSFALERHKIGFDKLFYSSEFPDLSNRTNVLLYDHNVRNGIKPVEIIDHHALKDKECQRKIVLHCGSALTLLYYTLHPE